MIKVGFDRQTFWLQKYGGVSRYFADLMRGLKAFDDICPVPLFHWHQNQYLSLDYPGKPLSSGLARKYERFMLRWSPPVRISNKVDIQHATFYLGRPKASSTRAFLVSTIHDMTPEIMPEYFPKGNPHRNKINWLNASDLIISNSNSTAQDLCSFYPHLESKVKTIHLSSAFDMAVIPQRPQALKDWYEPYFLIVGKRAGYKNMGMLYRAYAKSMPSRHGVHLILAGSGALGSSEKANLKELKIESFVHHLPVSDADLWYLYKSAAAILVPSLAEGFSLPLVEGLCADVRTICSDIPVHREVSREYSHRLDPSKEDEWADIMKNIDLIKTPSQRLLDQYQDRCLYYSRKRMVDQHAQVYRQLKAS